MKSLIKLSAFCFLFLIYSCATIIMPTGGPKDSTPPQIVKTYPENKAINFSDHKVVLYSNEFIELNLPQNNISVSPYSPIKPKSHVLGKKIIITFDEGLRLNTTYTIDFNSAIKDYNEGNLLSNYRLIFSTGPKLDSGKLMVGVNDAKTRELSEMTKVCLVKNKSDFYGRNFSYVSKASGGLADFSNLTQEPFFIYAFVDSNQNMTWDKTESIGFLNEPIREGQPLKKINLFQQSQKKTNFFVTPISETEYNVSASEDIIFPELLDAENELTILNPRLLKLIVKTGNHTQALRLRYNIDKYETLDLPANKSDKYIDKLSPVETRNSPLFQVDTIKVPFNAIIDRIDLGKIKLNKGTVPYKANFAFHKNNLLMMDLEFGKDYQLSIDSQAIYSSNRYNQPLSRPITTYPKDKYFKEIKITLDPSLASNRKIKIFRLIENEWIPIEKQAKLLFKDVYGDELRLNILIDNNNDGFWTTGDVEKEIQPEELYLETIKFEPKKTDYILKITPH